MKRLRCASVTVYDDFCMFVGESCPFGKLQLKRKAKKTLF